MSFTLATTPRRDRFTPPGPRLLEHEHPRLFALVRELAAATGQSVPSEIYLVNEVNAWVARRGGVLGFGARPIMGVGLPLVQSLTVDELKAVLAHEFGHHLGADVRLGLWIHKSRVVLSCVGAALGTSGIGKLVAKYGHRLMRVTLEVLRQQEFAADAVAARITSPAVVARTLRRVATTAPMFGLFIHEEVAPVLRAGYLPPVAEGFDQFLQSARVTGLMHQIDVHAESKQEATAFDTHPPLVQRLSALEALPAAADGRADERPASVLFGNVDRLVHALLQFFNGDDAVAQLRQIDWRDVPVAIFVAEWRATAGLFADALARFTFDTLPIGEQAFVEAGHAFVRPGEGPPVDRDAARRRAMSVLNAAIAAALVDAGWQVETAPGEPIVFVRDGYRWYAFDRLSAAAAGTLNDIEWRRECARLGLAGVRLSLIEPG